MWCPFCKSKHTKVIDKRDNEETNNVRRRRECEKCHKRFTTYERIEKVVLTVVKKDDRREPFDREKVKMGIMKAVKKRDIDDKQIEKMIDNIENKLMKSDRAEISVNKIGQMVLKELYKVDKLGAVLFASVYKEFRSLEDLQTELERIMNAN